MSQNLYLQRYATPGPRIKTKPADNLNLVIVIPSFRELHLDTALQNLINCEKPPCGVEVIVVINHSENAEEETRRINQESLAKGKETKKNAPSWINVHFITVYDMPAKHAGVGLARKIGMDEAVRRFEQLKATKDSIHKQGIIVCFDADCACESNYLIAIYNHFELSNTPACSIYYEHPIKGNGYSDLILKGIIQYELYLRYYVDALRWAGYPFAWQTVGSAIAVRSHIYQKQGGMNLRKAGEDFYFLQKLFSLPGFSELNTTTIKPSPRVSERVPFGTGKEISQWVNQQKEVLISYNPESFVDLQHFLTLLPKIYSSNEIGETLKQLPANVQRYLDSRNFIPAFIKIKNNAGNYSSFIKQFYAWFNGLKVLQFFHFARDVQGQNDVPVVEAAQWLIQAVFSSDQPVHTPEELLKIFRRMDKNWNYSSIIV